MIRNFSFGLALGTPVTVLVLACAPDAVPATDAWTGTMDTLPSGQIVVQNGADPVWQEGSEW